MRRNIIAVVCLGFALIAPVETAVAETSSLPGSWFGGPEVYSIVDGLFTELGLINGTGIEYFYGYSNAEAERQMIGGTSIGVQCVDTNGGENAGCQEIAPMAREMGSSVCGAGNSESIGRAEGLAFCAEGIVVATDNATLGQYGASAGQCAAYAALPSTDNTAPGLGTFADHGVGQLRESGTLPVTGYTLGAGFAPGEGWKDVLRLIYTGCKQGDGDCVTLTGIGNTSSGVPSRPRIARCSDPVRQELLSSLAYVLQGDDCDATEGDACSIDPTPDDGVVDTGLRHAFRPYDDGSLAGLFLELIGVRASIVWRNKITATALESIAASGCSAGLSPASAKLITPIPQHAAYCDGGDEENWYPDCQNDTIIPIGGDPIRKACLPEDDLCGRDGRAGVVQAISPAHGANPFPTHQCSRGSFAKRNFLASPHNVCPDGSKPSAGQCKLPSWRTASGPLATSFDCMNPSNSRPSTVSLSTDGRVYNTVMRSATGTVSQPSGNAHKVDVATWRFDLVNLAQSGLDNIFGKQLAASDYVCRENEVGPRVACILGRRSCSIAVSYHALAYRPDDDHHLRVEPLQLGGSLPNADELSSHTYPLARDLWLNAIGGFENLTADCLARGEALAYCTEQLAIANAIFASGEPDSLVAQLCIENDATPIPMRCEGTAGCGAPELQALSACLPQ